MIEYIEGDIFNSPAQVVVNTVNTVGVMGKGLALSFKNRYPEMFEAYRRACEKKQLKVGKLMLYYAPDYWLLLFPTKENWRYPSRLEYIEAGLNKFVSTYAEKNITSIAFPKLGCGNGELNWDDVKPLMEKYLSALPIDVYIYVGMGDNAIPEHKAQKQTMEWLKNHAKDMSFTGLLDDISFHSAMLPYIFTHGGSIWAANYAGDMLLLETEGQRQTISEEDLFQLWDRIRNEGIFAAKSTAINEVVYSLLLSLGYLSTIRFGEGRDAATTDGYQLNQGLGRAYALKGC